MYRKPILAPQVIKEILAKEVSFNKKASMASKHALWNKFDRFKSGRIERSYRLPDGGWKEEQHPIYTGKKN